ncbi:DnaJ like protein subfamily B member 6 [Nosema granulosis]|uniref:DnaJ like protein subfamily B member 6 n=1 Tax=Nosema granulosis TaxID=83296 RepID=A0A9P6H0U3_9MICR|nr:DnaJ like protein subfamily B member 6 [Nosema granulosis]
MFYKILFMLNVVKTDLAVEMQRVMNSFSLGDLDVTSEFFEKNKEEYLEEPLFKKNFLDYLISIGDYSTIIEKYPDLDPIYTKKAEELQRVIRSNSFEEITKLENDSPNSVEVIKANLRMAISNSNFKLAERYVNKISRSFKNNKELMTLAGQYYFVSGAYAIGIKFFREIGYTETVNEFLSLFTEYDEIKKENSINYKLRSLRSFYNKLNIKELSDSFSPSIYTHAKFEVLKEYLQLSTSNRKPDTSSLGKTYYVKMKDEYSRYLYLLSLIFDSNFEMAKKELASRKFERADYERKIKLEIEQKEFEEQERRKRERRRGYRQEQRVPQQQQTRKAGSDFLGYYKRLGLTPKASPKDIRKAYLKIVAKNKVNKMNEKQKKEWEQELIKLNKALEILSNKKNKEMYDNGIDPENPQPQYDFGGGHGFNFQGFDGAFADFFGGRSFRGGRGAQFVFL